MASKKTAKGAPQKFVGEVVMLPIDKVQPNSWNPNRMTPQLKASLRHGLRTDGWLMSQALLVWGQDDKGETRNLIIDGEHRWREARELGFEQAPMVVINGFTEAQAKALTVKMNQKRGEWDLDLLGGLLRNLSPELENGVTGLDFGFTDDSLAKLMATQEQAFNPPDAGGNGSKPTMPDASGLPASTVRLVQLFLDEKTHPQFAAAIKKLGASWGTQNVTDTALRAVLEAAERA